MSATANDNPIVRLSDITPTNVEWLWPARLPFGKPVLLDGDPQEGKSLLTLDWAARLTTARPWPDGVPIPHPVPVLLLAGEDDAADTIIPRLRAAGADLNLVHLWHGRPNGDRTFAAPRFPDDISLLRDAIQKTGARFVVADPIISYLGASAGLNGPQLRKALTPLADVLHETRANLTMVRHLNKNDGRQSALYRGIGSIQLIAAVRSALMVGRSPDDPDLHLLACTKTNLDAMPPTLSFRICRNDDGLPILDWGGPVTVYANDLLLPGGVRYGDSVARAADFLRDTLADDIRPAKEVYDLARDLGISRRILLRARASLNIFPCQIWENGRNVWHWRLATGATPEEEIADLNRKLAEFAATQNEPPSPPL